MTDTHRADVTTDWTAHSITFVARHCAGDDCYHTHADHGGDDTEETP